MVRTSLFVGLIVVCGALQNAAQAQSNSLFGSSGPRANSTTASRSSSSSSASSMGGSAGAGAGTGGARASGAGAGSGTGGDPFQGPQLGTTGDLSAQAAGNTGGFVGANNGAFIGNRMAGTSGMSTTQRPSFGALGAGGGSDFNSQNQSRQGQSATRNFRPRFRVGFEYAPSATAVSDRAIATMTRLATRHPYLAGLQVNIDDAGMAEIRGTAPSAESRTLIENVVRLEPGVRGVTNLIVVAPPAAANP